MTNAVKSLPQVLEELELLANWLTQKLNIEPTIVQMKKLDIVSNLYPEYVSMLSSAKQEVAHTLPLKNVDLTPTQIASKLNEQTGRSISNREVNQALKELDLQTKNTSISGHSSQWELTEKGKKYGRVYLTTSDKNNWSGNQIKWSEEVLELLKQNLSNLT
jgi:hypothetical protein